VRGNHEVEGGGRLSRRGSRRPLQPDPGDSRRVAARFGQPGRWAIRRNGSAFEDDIVIEAAVAYGLDAIVTRRCKKFSQRATLLTAQGCVIE
jgi:hypothetical protein